MGTNVSNQVIKTTTDVVQNIMTSVSTTTENQAIAKAYSDQNATLDAAGATLINCPLKIVQNSNVSATAFGDFNNGLSNDLTSQLQAKLVDQVLNQLQQKNSGINFGQTNIANLKTDVQTYLNQNIQTLVQQGIRNTVEASAGAGQAATIILRGVYCKDSPAGIDQTSVVQVMAKNIASNIVNNTVKNAVSADVQHQITTSVSQSNVGLDIGLGLILFVLVVIVVLAFGVKSVGSFFKSPVGIFILFVLVGALITVIVLRFVKKK